MDKNGLVYRSIIMVIMNFFIRIIGFIYGIFLSRLLGAEELLDLISLKNVIKINVNYVDIVLKPLLASLFMVGFIYKFTYDINSLEFSSPMAFLSTLFVAALAYIFILVLTKAIPKRLFGFNKESH